MQTIVLQLPPKKLIGITTRTNNKELFTCDPATNPVAALVQKYVHQGLAEKIKHRKNPGTTLCAYTRYESDFNGDFTYLIGEEVTDTSELPEGFETLEIPAQTYVRLTSPAGPMPQVCIDLWQKIWTMTPAELGGKRSYVTDFELYDERSHDHQQAVLDIYLGIGQ